MLYLIIVLLTSLRLSVRAQAHLDSLSAACIAISPRIECELVTINTKPRETHPRATCLGRQIQGRDSDEVYSARPTSATVAEILLRETLYSSGSQCLLACW